MPGERDEAAGRGEGAESLRADQPREARKGYHDGLIGVGEWKAGCWRGRSRRGNLVEKIGVAIIKFTMLHAVAHVVVERHC